MPTLHLIIGPWGSGKTSLVVELVPLLPNVAVFDWDLLIPGLSVASGKDVHTDPSTWDGLRETWLSIVGAKLAAKRDVVLCGPLRPEEIGPMDGATIRCAFLDCPDELLTRRLAARGATRGEIADEVAMSKELRESNLHRFPVDNRQVRSVAIDVSKWVTGKPA